MKRFLLSAIIGILVLPVGAKIKLPAILSDNMVLQQQTSVNLWGDSDVKDPDNEITITTSWDDKEYIATPVHGSWSVKIQTPKSGGPYTITISDGETLILNNVMIGEVWLCSGQSNMEMPIKGFQGQPVNGSLDIIAQATPENNIRMITIQRNSSCIPLQDCDARWEESTPQSVANVSATAYFFACYLQNILNVPVGIISSSWGGSKIEAWINKETIEEQFPEVLLEVLNKDLKDISKPHVEPTLLYNAMINPIQSYTIKGAIWYQGEANRDKPELYKRLFPAMVQLWRNVWKQGDFPFYYVQIAPYDYGRENADKIEAAQLRQVQLECMYLIPNSGIAVTADIGERTCIHPAAKSEVGQRLALWALSHTYGKDGIPFSGPLYKSAVIKEKAIEVEFKYSEMGMTSHGEDIIGFEIAGADSVYYPATAKLISGAKKISLEYKIESRPVSIRYCFKNYQPVNLFSNFGLPVSPFEATLK